MKGIIRNQEQMVKKMNFNSKKKNWTIELLEQIMESIQQKK